jgi:NitT/TauT family transport system substrate-binding protein
MKFIQRAGLSLAMLVAAVSAKADQISVTHWGVLLYGAPYAVAIEKGFFKQSGVDVTGILTSKGGGTTVRNVIQGGLPYGEVALGAAIAAAREGLDIKIVNTGVQNLADLAWVTLPDSPVKTIKDLEGRKLAYTSAKSVTDMVTTMVVDAQGLKNINRVAVGGIGAQITALQQKGVDAAFLGEPVYTQNKAKFRTVFFAKDMLPDPNMTQTVGVTTSEFAKANPKKIRGIIEGRRKGVEFIYKNPKEAAAIIAKVYGQDPVVMEEAVANMAKAKYWSTGEIDIKGMNSMSNGLKLMGVIQDTPEWGTLVDPRFVK